jgi:hypothetical protein
MADKLVTIATFDQPPKARLAQNALEAAGIKSTIADETTVAMDWLLGAAIGWVKVQVLEEDAERAVVVLEESLGKDEPVDPEELAAEAEAAEREEDDRAPAEPSPAPKAAEPEPPEPTDENSVPTTSERDEYTHRFFLAAIFGLIVPLVWFYAVYLFLNAAFGEGSLTPQNRNKLRIGGVILLFGAFMAYFLFQLYGDPFW